MKLIDFINKYCPNIDKNINLLSISNCGISDLDGISMFTNLKELDCSNNNINDLTPLYSLPDKYALTMLKCNDNKISDLKVLESLTNLRLLYCEYNQIDDLSPLKNLKFLELTCYNNKIVSYKPLEFLDRLLHLYTDKCNNLEELKDVLNIENRIDKIKDYID